MVNTYTLALLALLTSFASMSYELVLAQTLSFLSDEVVLWESLSLGFFIAATGAGLFLYKHLSLKKNTLTFFFESEILLAIVGLLTLPLIFFLHITYRIYIVDYRPHSAFLKPLNWVLLSCQAPNIVIGFLSGLELQSLFELSSQEKNISNQHSYFILVLYHLGALLASLSFAFCLYKHIDTFQLICMASFCNGVVVFWCLNAMHASVMKKTTVGFLFLLFFASVQQGWTSLKDLQIKNFYYNSMSVIFKDGNFEQNGPVSLHKLHKWAKELPPVERRLSSYQVMDVVQDSEKKEWKLFLDGHFQFSSQTERFYHETLAHAPIMLSGDIPRRILIMGGGDGLLARELVKYGDRIRRIDLVEIDKEMIELGNSLPFSTLNANSLNHRLVNIHIADAFTWLRSSHESFDAIYIDFPYPYTFEGLRLYSKEFLKDIGKHLNANGFLVMDIPIFSAGNKGWEDHVGSLIHQSGFAKALAFEANYGETFVFATKQEKSLIYAFRDVGLPLEVLKKESFQSEHIELKEGTQKDVNSILKPKRMSMPDLWK